VDGSNAFSFAHLPVIVSHRKSTNYILCAKSSRRKHVALRMSSRNVTVARNLPMSRYTAGRPRAACGVEVNTAIKTVIALMMEAAMTSETLVNFYQTTRRYNPEDSHLRLIRTVRNPRKQNGH
jgi:hypothetical protein